MLEIISGPGQEGESGHLLRCEGERVGIIISFRRDYSGHDELKVVDALVIPITSDI